MDLLVLGALIEHCRDKSFCWPSVQKIANECYCSVRTVQYRLASLKKAGHVAERPSTDNLTGRVLVLVWREEADKRRAARHREAESQTYSQGIPPTMKRFAPPRVQPKSPPPVQPPASELSTKEGEKKGSAHALNFQTKKEPEPVEPFVMSRDWMTLEPDNFFRTLQERKLAAEAAGTPLPAAGNADRRRPACGAGRPTDMRTKAGPHL